MGQLGGEVVGVSGSSARLIMPIVSDVAKGVVGALVVASVVVVLDDGFDLAAMDKNLRAAASDA